MPNAERGPVARIGTLLLALIATGVAAEAALVPITLDHFGCNGAYGILANVVAIPLSSFVIMPAMILALLLEPVGLADSCYTVLRLSLDLLITMSLEVQRWPGAVIRAPAFSDGRHAAVRLRWPMAPALANPHALVRPRTARHGRRADDRRGTGRPPGL